MGYGSEFRDVATLANTFQRHPNWTRMSRILTHGLEWPLKPLNNKCRLAGAGRPSSLGTTREP